MLGEISNIFDSPLLCFGEYQAHTHLAAAVCCLANKEAKRSSTLCPSWSRFVHIEDQCLHKGLGLLTTRFPNGFDGQAPLHQ